MFRNIVQSSDPHGRFSFEIHDLDLAVVNGIRRVILTDIPVVAFDGEDNPSFKVLANNGPLHNEIILQRFGLIPIHMTAEETETFNPDEYEFEINVENETSQLLNVTTKNMTVTKAGQKVDATKYFPADSYTKEYILITRLRANEKLHVKGKAVKQTAHYHAGFCPVSLCSFTFMGSAAPQDTNPLTKERAFYKNEYGDPRSILFSLETETALSPTFLVSKSVDMLISKVNAFISSETLSLPKRTDNGMEWHIEGEDDTLGNLIQSIIHNHYIREGQATSKGRQVTYAGYFCPHPLETTVVVRICIADHTEVSDSEYIDEMIGSCARVTAILERVRTEWNNVTGM